MLIEYVIELVWQLGEFFALRGSLYKQYFKVNLIFVNMILFMWNFAN